MGRLFTYMVKAAAGEQPAPGPEFYEFRMDPTLSGSYAVHPAYANGHYDQFRISGKGVPFRNSLWNDFVASVRHITPEGTDRDLAQQVNFARQMYDASMSSDKDAFFDLKGAKDYVTALNSSFTSPEAIYEYLEKYPEYRAALQHLADTGSWEKLENIWAKAGDAPGMTDPTWGWRPDHLLSYGAGSAQLALNLAMAEGARRKKDAEARKKEAEEAQQSQVQPPAAPVTASGGQPAAPVTASGGQPAAPVTASGGQPAAPVTASGGQPAAPVTAPVTNPQQPKVQAPTPPNSSAVAASVQKPGGRLGPMVRDAVRWGLYALQPKLKVRDTIQQNLAEGKSMYAGMTASTPGMTPGQIQALRARGFVGNPQQQAAALAAARENAAKNGMTLPNSEHDAYTGAGLRMVGHSADGRTRTYVGKSGRGRITVGDDAGSGYHYRGNGNIDRNVQSNYADLRQPNTQRPVTPPQIKSKATTTTPRG